MTRKHLDKDSITRNTWKKSLSDQKPLEIKLEDLAKLWTPSKMVWKPSSMYYHHQHISLNLIFTLYCQHLYTNKPSSPRIIPDDDKMLVSSGPVNQNFIQTIPVRKGLSRSCLAAWGTGWLVEQYPSGRCWCLPRSSLYCPQCSETLSSPPAEWLVSGADCSLLSTA